MYYQNFSGDAEQKFCLRRYYGGVEGWGNMEGWGVEYHPNGKMKNRGTFKDGIAVGKCVRLYWENGTLKFCGEIDEKLKCSGVCFSKTGRLGALITGGVGVLDL
jgi:antitoxin component YwqK of YwqJK toxin-antitoxin module